MKLLGTRRVTVKELVERLGVSRSTLWRWEQQGRLPPKHRFGPNTVGWLETEIEAWSEECSNDRASQ